jgi:hypothetical protein
VGAVTAKCDVFALLDAVAILDAVALHSAVLYMGAAGCALDRQVRGRVVCESARSGRFVVEAQLAHPPAGVRTTVVGAFAVEGELERRLLKLLEESRHVGHIAVVEHHHLKARCMVNCTTDLAAHWDNGTRVEA